MKIVGVTGPSGAGKSTVLECFERRGVRGIRADRVYHNLLETDYALLRQLAEHFPSAFPDGRTGPGGLDRKVLGEIVFSNNTAKDDLEHITYPAIVERITAMLDEYGEAGEQAVVVEAIGLIESGLDKLCDIVIAVLARPDLMTARITARDNVSLHYAASRLNAQKSDAFYKKHAGYVVLNNESLEQLKSETDKLIDIII